MESVKKFIVSNAKKYYIQMVFFALFAMSLIVAFKDEGLAMGLAVLFILTGLTFIFLDYIGLKSRYLWALLLVALAVHLGAVLFIYGADFYPFAGGAGGFKTAHEIAEKLSENFRAGKLSFEGVPHYENGRYPYRHYEIIIALLYMITIPAMVVGQLFNVWLAVLVILVSYLIMRELGASEKVSFLAGLIISLYPSHLLYGSMLLKDGLATLLVLYGLLLSIKLVKNFSWRTFLIFFIATIGLNQLRFYVNYALILTFAASWLLLSNLPVKKRILTSLIIIPLIGLSPHILHGQGFFGMHVFNSFFNKEKIAFYHEEAYQPTVSGTDCDSCNQETIERKFFEDNKSSSLCESCISEGDILESSSQRGYDSSWKREKVIFGEHPILYTVSYFKYAWYIIFGPFPWQLSQSRHLFALFETIPFYILMLFIARGIYQTFKLRIRPALVLLIFSFILTAVMTIFISNFGIVTRIRMPIFISLLCFLPFGMVYFESKLGYIFKNKINNS